MARTPKNLKEKYRGISELCEGNREINQHGLIAILNIMKIHELNYKCKLTDITFPLVKMYIAEIREMYEINTTGQVIKILDFIRENDLLNEKGED